MYETSRESLLSMTWKKKRKNEHYGTNKPLLRWKQATDTVFFESYQIQQLYNILCELKFKNKFII